MQDMAHGNGFMSEGNLWHNTEKYSVFQHLSAESLGPMNTTAYSFLVYQPTEKNEKNIFLLFIKRKNAFPSLRVEMKCPTPGCFTK